MHRFISFACLLITTAVYPQNLVPNPGFEDYNYCPRTTADIRALKDWFQPSAGSTDYFNTCSEGSFAGAPDNIFGYQQPHNGNGYIGFATHLHKNYREYISVKLKQPLKKGKDYVVKFWASLANTSEYYAADLQVLFSDSAVGYTRHYNMPYTAQLNSDGKKPIDDTIGWTEVKWVYKAKGHEQYMTIGNFNDDDHTQVFKLATKKKHTGNFFAGQVYYYLDDACVSLMNPDSSCNCKEDTTQLVVVKKDTAAVAPPEFVPDRKMVLNNIFFETNKAILLPTSFTELDKLIIYLHANPTIKIELSGYTDSDGKEAANKALSYSRAKAVANYLLLKGISEGRITYSGYGSGNPIADNTTDEGKAKNRRVEFKLVTDR